MSGTDRIRCDFCEHRCALKDGQTGLCGVRQRRGERIVTTNYGEHVSLATDPIEKKPLYHMLPGGRTLSSALFGCNFTCTFCQNCTISQPDLFRSLTTRYIAPADLAARLSAADLPVAAFTYSEPTVWQDYVIDAATEVRAVGGRSVMITNGFFTSEALTRLLPVIDAFNIDLKGNGDFYRRLCGGNDEGVIRNIRSLATGTEGLRPDGFRPVLEVTTMVLEGEHTEGEILELGHILADAGVQVWHLSAFHPAYRMQDHPATSEEFLERIYRRIKAEIPIPHLYAFSRREREYQQTLCPTCGTVCLDRRGFLLVGNYLVDGRCPNCGSTLYGIFG